ncbi:uncharacterized protein PADG_03930 [Paracoccidioides brasiliensis Pb18]|uniref:Uncharacterized protein n=1 Tax=Paracoccidioides brasiliensis (strain Pb18) TaxID=502780 RepID=C1G9J4_PARBD|nr:uncharacterized protein PADG_03930 [Paracoccidioides brasiliensis Pb18]EEH47846.2 hypothetical protein PADG_03930 [Paracoccidioides brasiliensis Pb18]
MSRKSAFFGLYGNNSGEFIRSHVSIFRQNDLLNRHKYPQSQKQIEIFGEFGLVRIIISLEPVRRPFLRIYRRASNVDSMIGKYGWCSLTISTAMAIGTASVVGQTNFLIIQDSFAGQDFSCTWWICLPEQQESAIGRSETFMKTRRSAVCRAFVETPAPHILAGKSQGRRLVRFTLSTPEEK